MASRGYSSRRTTTLVSFFAIFFVIPAHAQSNFENSQNSLDKTWEQQRAKQEAEYPHVDHFVFDAGPLARALAERARPLDWRSIAPTAEEPVVYLGETHTFAPTRAELATGISQLKVAGVTHLALETFDTLQDAFDNVSDPEAADRIKNWEEEGVGKELSQGYLDLIAAARAAGLRILAIDKPRKASDEGPDHMLAERDKYMAKHLAAVLSADPNARIIVLVGANHAALDHQPRELAELGYRSRSFKFLTPGYEFQDPSRADEIPRVADADDYRAHLALAKAGLSDWPLLLPSGDLPYTGLLAFPSLMSARIKSFMIWW